VFFEEWDDPLISGFRLLPTAAQQLNLLFASDERRLASAQRLVLRHDSLKETELGHDAAALHCFHRRRAGYEIRAVTFEIRLAGKEVLIPTLTSPVVFLYVLDKGERSRSEHVRLGKSGSSLSLAAL
jgi:hypothetical protein